MHSLEAIAQRREMQTQLNTEQVQVCIKGIQERLSLCPSIPESIAVFDLGHLQRPRVERNPIKMAHFLDGLVVIGTIREGAVDKSHQLSVRGDTEIAYYRRTADATFRTPSCEDVYLNGIGEIAADDVAVAGIAHLYAATAEEGEQGWPHVYSLESGLAMVRKPVAIPA
jgi:hypothetical protein